MPAELTVRKRRELRNCRQKRSTCWRCVLGFQLRRLSDRQQRLRIVNQQTSQPFHFIAQHLGFGAAGRPAEP